MTRQTNFDSPVAIITMTCALWMICLTLAPAQAPPLPASGVHDDTLLFNEAQRADLGVELAEAAQRTGVRVFVAALTFSSGATAHDAALHLARAWADAEPGIVILYDRGKQGAAVAASPPLWRKYPADETATLLAKAGEALAKADVKPEAKLQTAASLVIQQLQRMETARVTRNQPLSSADARLAKAVAGALVLLLVFAILIARWSDLRRLARTERHYFPDVEVAPRLGAPFGGGVVVANEDPEAVG